MRDDTARYLVTGGDVTGLLVATAGSVGWLWSGRSQQLQAFEILKPNSKGQETFFTCNYVLREPSGFIFPFLLASVCIPLHIKRFEGWANAD